jgi:hypothetical protein
MVSDLMERLATIPCPGCGALGIESINQLTLVCESCGEPRVPVNPTEPVFLKRPADER